MRSNKAATSILFVTVIGILALVVLFGLLIFGWYINGYNKAVRMDETVEKAWGDVDAQLQRRFDLVPNLVNTVKGYATHESELFESIAKSREKYFSAPDNAGKMAASDELSGFLSRLLMLQENYPDLKANQSFLSLQDQLEGTENRISVARNRYNETVEKLNAYSREFIGSFFCKKAGVEAREYFEATEPARTEVPVVDFNSQ